VRLTKRYIHKNGSIVWVDFGTALRRDKDGQPLYLISSFNDITERKQAEEALRLRESYQAAILENQPGLLWLKDAMAFPGRKTVPSPFPAEKLPRKNCLARPISKFGPKSSLKNTGQMTPGSSQPKPPFSWKSPSSIVASAPGLRPLKPPCWTSGAM